MTSIAETEELLTFVRDAAAKFLACPDTATFGAVTPGSYLGIRWGFMDRGVLVVKLDEAFTPMNFVDATLEAAREAVDIADAAGTVAGV